MVDPLTANMNIPVPLSCPNVIAVASGKGGVGKTWFSATLCHALARQQQNILLFDGDLGLANVDIQLGLNAKKDLGAVIDGKSTLKGSITRFTEGNFDIIAGFAGSGSLAHLPTQRVAALRQELIGLAPNYDRVVVDLGAGVDRAVMMMAGPAGFTLMVVTDELTSLTDAYKFIKMAQAANAKARIGIVVNMATTQKEGMEAYEKIYNTCKNFLKYEPPLVGIIRRDAKVRDAIKAQVPLLTRHPSADAAQDVDAIAHKVSVWSG